MLLFILSALLTCAASALGPSPDEHAIGGGLQKRQEDGSRGDDFVVDLGYARYRGFHNNTSGLDNWFGIRFAAPPTGDLRWQLPQAPAQNRTSIIQATNFAPQCPQSSDRSPPVPGKAAMSGGMPGDEDCLFLNVYKPANKTNLPVLYWIHGGGYGTNGQAQEDFGTILNANDNSFVGVEIQYRLGAFGFLASDEVYRNGVVNAGLHDQYFGLEWVQSYISLFGGNASAVTIMGESAGGGSVMLMGTAYGGTLGSKLFHNIIAESPYLPMQYGYKDWIPSQAYYAFATQAGCAPSWAYGNSSQTIFQCLASKSTEDLQKASFAVSPSGLIGTWAFLPVTDGSLVPDIPSKQLLKKHVNGKRALIGNNANEGVNFTPQDINTEEDLVAWLQRTFPLFTTSDIAKVLMYYPSSNATDDMDASKYATLGYTGATAVNESQVGTGQQQRADDIYAETTFVCPSYWMAEAYTGDRSSYKYQYSVPLGSHATDLTGYFGNPTAPQQGPDFARAFRRIIGNFVIKNDPSISNEVANGPSAESPGADNPASSWPAFTIQAPYQLNLNETGGTPYEASRVQGAPFNVTQYREPGLRNNLTLHNAYTWEGGRGYRCDMWRSLGAVVPE